MHQHFKQVISHSGTTWPYHEASLGKHAQLGQMQPEHTPVYKTGDLSWYTVFFRSKHFRLFVSMKVVFVDCSNIFHLDGLENQFNCSGGGGGHWTHVASVKQQTDWSKASLLIMPRQRPRPRQQLSRPRPRPRQRH